MPKLTAINLVSIMLWLLLVIGGLGRYYVVNEIEREIDTKLSAKLTAISASLDNISVRLDDDNGTGWPIIDQRNYWQLGKLAWEASDRLSDVPFPMPDPLKIRELRVSGNL
ncbi:hypothetical protein QEH52_01835 [Coraliomargarita sp. SDUM461003]|uniref:Uncharacterized protein n=1 Tax=Thalassobacterium maritimum TaxID=3041265 RepID=A0ABU1AQ19_9BACT|nr:hypothetical protein [Coraliomargarita sp. SDUM461003]MDQ8206233.1 hypothetical protein [Coraliomargarita sp. SDUM461003]